MQLIDEVKLIFSADPTPAPEPPAEDKNEVTLADGTMWQCDAAPAEGVKVSALGAEGVVPVAAGDYTDEAGNIITVDDNSTIVSIKAVQAPVAASAEEVQAQFNAFKAEAELKFQALTEKVEASEKTNNLLIAKFKESGESVANMMLAFKEYAEQAPEPIVKTENTTKRPLQAWEKVAQSHGYVPQN